MRGRPARAASCHGGERQAGGRVQICITDLYSVTKPCPSCVQLRKWHRPRVPSRTSISLPSNASSAVRLHRPAGDSSACHSVPRPLLLRRLHPQSGSGGTVCPPGDCEGDFPETMMCILCVRVKLFRRKLSQSQVSWFGLSVVSGRTAVQLIPLRLSFLFTKKVMVSSVPWTPSCGSVCPSLPTVTLKWLSSLPIF